MTLKLEDSLLDGIPSHQPMYQYRVLLPYPIGSIGRLILYCGIPPRVDYKHVVRGRKGQPDSPGLKGEEHHLRTIGRLKTLNYRTSLSG